MQDFIRRMPEASDDLRRRRSLFQRIHIDVPLLILLVLLLVQVRVGSWQSYLQKGFVLPVLLRGDC